MSSNTQVATAPQTEARNIVPTIQEAQQMDWAAKAFVAGGCYGFTSPAQVVSLMLIAHAEGRPIASVAAEYHIIEQEKNGVKKTIPTLKATAMLGRFRAIGGRVEWDESQGEEPVTGRFYAPGMSKPFVSHWSIERAKKAGIYKGKELKIGRNGQPYETLGNWYKFPQEMMRARAISEGIRAVAPEILYGFYAPEELSDQMSNAPVEPSAPTIEANAVVANTPHADYDPNLAVNFDTTPTRNISVAGPKTAHVAPQTTPVEQTPTSAQKRPENATTTSTLSERKARPDSEIADDLDWDAFNDLADSACALGMPSSKFPQLNRGATLGELRRACAVVKQAMEEIRSGRVYSAARAAAKTEQVEPVAANSANSANSDDEWAGIDMDEEV